MAKNKEQKQAAKEDSRAIKRTLKFMISVAWKERPSLYFVYVLMFVLNLIPNEASVHQNL